MKQAEVEGKGLEETDPPVFGVRVKVVSSRLATLRIVCADQEDSLDAHNTEVDKSATTTHASESGSLYPIPKHRFQALHTMRFLKGLADSFDSRGISDAAQMQTGLDEFDERKKCLELLAVACRSSMTALQSARRTKEAHDKSRAAKLSKQEAVAAKAKAKAVAAARGADKKRDGGAPSQFAIFDRDLEFAETVSVHTGQGTSSEQKFDEPFVVRPCPTLVEASDKAQFKLNAMVFKAGLIRATKPRDARVLTAIPEVRKELFSAAGVDDEKLLLEDNKSLNQVLIWAAKKGAEAVSIEHGGACCLRATTMGVTTVFMVNVSAFRMFFSQLCGRETLPSLLEVRRFFQSLDQDGAETLFKAVRHDRV